jgi:hypothetical protein
MKRLLPHEVLVNYLVDDKLSHVKNDRVHDILVKTIMYFNNLIDALLGRTQGQVDAMYNLVNGLSWQIHELQTGTKQPTREESHERNV